MNLAEIVKIGKNAVLGAGLVALAVSGTAIMPKDADAEVIYTSHKSKICGERDTIIERLREGAKQVPAGYGLLGDNGDEGVIEFYVSKEGKTWTAAVSSWVVITRASAIIKRRTRRRSCWTKWAMSGSNRCSSAPWPTIWPRTPTPTIRHARP